MNNSFNKYGVRKVLIVLSIITPALTAAPAVFAEASPSPSPQVSVNVSGGGTNIVNTNTNSNSQTQTNNQTVTVGAFVPRQLPATGAGEFQLAGMLASLPVGIYLSKFRKKN